MSVFKRRWFPAEIILLCVRWYCRYGISYRELEEMMGERGDVTARAVASDDRGFGEDFDSARCGVAE